MNIDIIIDDMNEALTKNECSLGYFKTTRNISFVESVISQYYKYDRISEKQENAIRKIYNSIGPYDKERIERQIQKINEPSKLKPINKFEDIDDKFKDSKIVAYITKGELYNLKKENEDLCNTVNMLSRNITKLKRDNRHIKSLLEGIKTCFISYTEMDKHEDDYDSDYDY